MKNIVLFDFFGVISSEIAPIWFRRHLDDAAADKIKSDIVSLADVGLITEWEMYERISREINVAPEQIAKEWQELININTELVEKIKRIKEKYPVYLLSNAIEPFLSRILSEHSLYSLFDKIFISSEMGIAKPSGEFFMHVLDDIGAKAENAVITLIFLMPAAIATIEAAAKATGIRILTIFFSPESEFEFFTKSEGNESFDE